LYATTGVETKLLLDVALFGWHGTDPATAFLHGVTEKVVVENDDYRDIFDRYDGPDTLFYLNPPYADETFQYRRGKDFDYAALAKALDELEGR
jgi:site-specific DNA-adenine methylase